MGTVIIIIVLIAIVYGVVTNIKSEVSRFADNTSASLLGERGRCIDCKYCRRDTSHQFSNTDYFCVLSRCDHIADSTVMDCMIKPTISEEDLKELFALNIWTPEGKEYIRNSILGKVMSFSDVDAFLKELPVQHPEYINKDAIKNQAGH